MARGRYLTFRPYEPLDIGIVGRKVGTKKGRSGEEEEEEGEREDEERKREMEEK